MSRDMPPPDQEPPKLPDLEVIRNRRSFSRAKSVTKTQAQSETRRKNAKQPFKNVSESALELVKEGLKDYHSPEQIAGRLKSSPELYQKMVENGYKLRLRTQKGKMRLASKSLTARLKFTYL